jgi:hypothetical protein
LIESQGKHAILHVIADLSQWLCNHEALGGKSYQLEGWFYLVFRCPGAQVLWSNQRIVEPVWLDLFKYIWTIIVSKGLSSGAWVFKPGIVFSAVWKGLWGPGGFFYEGVIFLWFFQGIADSWGMVTKHWNVE